MKTTNDKTTAQQAVATGDLLGLPKFTIKAGSPGEIFLVDECNHVVANFRVKTPDCHKAPYGNRDNFDAGMNMDAANWLIAEMQRRWSTPSYARFLSPNTQ